MVFVTRFKICNSQRDKHADWLRQRQLRQGENLDLKSDKEIISIFTRERTESSPFTCVGNYWLIKNNSNSKSGYNWITKAVRCTLATTGQSDLYSHFIYIVSERSYTHSQPCRVNIHLLIFNMCFVEAQLSVRRRIVAFRWNRRHYLCISVDGAPLRYAVLRYVSYDWSDSFVFIHINW